MFKYLNSLKLKVKIRIALVLLFAAITLLGMLGGNYVQRTSNDAILTIRGGQNSINNVMEMYKAINDMAFALALENSTSFMRRQELLQADAKFERHFNLVEAKMKDEKDLQRMSDLKLAYEEVGQLAIGQYLSKQIFEGLHPNDLKTDPDETVDLRIVTEDSPGQVKHIACTDELQE